VAYAIRPFLDSDAEALSAILRGAIAIIGPTAYSVEQVAAWSARAPTPQRFRDSATAGIKIIVATDASNQPVAYALLEPDGHLDHLYCHPEHTRQGLAEQLLVNAEQIAASAGVSRLYTEASELARSAFERAGYSVTHRRNFDIQHLGKAVAIHNYAMEKLLG